MSEFSDLADSGEVGSEAKTVENGDVDNFQEGNEEKNTKDLMQNEKCLRPF